MKITKLQQIVYGIILGIFVLLGFAIKFPIFAPSSEKQSFFQSASLLEIFVVIVFITGLYGLFIYFIPVKGVAEQIKSFRDPILKLQKTKFEYWLKSQLYEYEISEQGHHTEIEGYKTRRALEEIDVLSKAAELNDMEVGTLIKFLQAEADTNYINASTEKEKAEAEILKKAVSIMPKMSPLWQAYIISCVTKVQNSLTEDLELKKEINEVIKDKQKEELRKAKIENNNLADKYKRNKQASE